MLDNIDSRGEMGDNKGQDIAKNVGETVKESGALIRLHTYGDALRESLGPAYKSNKAEYEYILKRTKELGVEVVFREGTMVYEPNTGKPGRMIIDPELSIGALRHEFKHVLDDAANGYPGFRLIQNRNKFWQFEYRGYLEELNLARQIKDLKAEEFILKEIQNRKKEIFGGN